MLVIQRAYVGHLRAYDSHSLRLCWSFKAPMLVIYAPMTVIQYAYVGH